MHEHKMPKFQRVSKTQKAVDGLKVLVFSKRNTCSSCNDQNTIWDTLEQFDAMMTHRIHMPYKLRKYEFNGWSPIQITHYMILKLAAKDNRAQNMYEPEYNGAEYQSVIRISASWKKNKTNTSLWKNKIPKEGDSRGR